MFISKWDPSWIWPVTAVAAIFQNGRHSHFQCIISRLIILIGAWSLCLYICFQGQGIQIWHYFFNILCPPFCFTIWPPIYTKNDTFLYIFAQNNDIDLKFVSVPMFSGIRNSNMTKILKYIMSVFFFFNMVTILS